MSVAVEPSSTSNKIRHDVYKKKRERKRRERKERKTNRKKNIKER